MNTLEYIDAYFTQTLNEEERSKFEKRCVEDEAFAGEVAFYLTARQSAKDELLKEKKQQWNGPVKQQTQDVVSIMQQPSKADDDVWFLPSSIKKSFSNRWVSYAAAACLVLALSVYLFETNTSLKKYSSNYIANNYASLSQTMDASHDSLQLGIAAYNNKQYDKALTYFEGVEKVNPQNSDAKKYAGLSYLQKKDYDNAINKFDDLAAEKNLFSNAGDFLKAISLLQRNNAGDKEAAKKLLQKVVNEKEEGSEKAVDWLRKFN